MKALRFRFQYKYTGPKNPGIFYANVGKYLKRYESFLDVTPPEKFTILKSTDRHAKRHHLIALSTNEVHVSVDNLKNALERLNQMNEVARISYTQERITSYKGEAFTPLIRGNYDIQTQMRDYLFFDMLTNYIRCRNFTWNGTYANTFRVSSRDTHFKQIDSLDSDSYTKNMIKVIAVLNPFLDKQSVLSELFRVDGQCVSNISDYALRMWDELLYGKPEETLINTYGPIVKYLDKNQVTSLMNIENEKNKVEKIIQDINDVKKRINSSIEKLSGVDNNSGVEYVIESLYSKKAELVETLRDAENSNQNIKNTLEELTNHMKGSAMAYEVAKGLLTIKDSQEVINRANEVIAYTNAVLEVEKTSINILDTRVGNLLQKLEVVN